MWAFQESKCRELAELQISRHRLEICALYRQLDVLCRSHLDHAAACCLGFW